MTEGVGRGWAIWQNMKFVASWEQGPPEPQFRGLGITYLLPLETRRWHVFRKKLSANQFR